MQLEYDEYRRLCERRQSLFEKIPDDKPVTLYADFDLKKEHIQDGEELYDCTNALIDIAKRAISKTIQDFGGVTPPRFAIKTATNHSKISFHIIVPSHKTTKLQQHELFKRINKYINEMRDDKWAEDYLPIKPDRISQGFFDMSVYSTGRKMRTAYSTKEGESRPFEIIEGTFRDTVISMPYDDSESLHIPVPEKKPSIQGPVITGDDATEKYKDYMSIIPSSQWSPYMDWFRIQRASANIGIPFEIYDQFMRPCNGYDYENNLRIYQMPPDDKNGRLGWKYIYDTAYNANPTAKMQLDQKWKEDDTFCKYKFISIIAKDDTKEIEDLTEQLKLAELKEKKCLIKELKTKIEKLRNYETYKLRKKYFEKFHFKCLNPPCYIRKTENEYLMLSHEKMSKLFMNLNGFIETWFQDVSIREVKGYDFYPPPMADNPNYLNLYTGMKYENIPVVLTADEIKTNSHIFIKHLWYLSGKNNAVLEYLLNYLAHMLQFPGELPRTSIILKSEQGSGKSVFFEHFGNCILGEKYLLSTSKMDDILGRFPQISQKFLVIMDETNAKESFLANENIKSFITSPTLTYERKGIDGIQIKNCCRQFFFANGDYPVKIEQTDRRFVVAECSTDIKNNTQYFKALIKAFKTPAMVKSFALFLKHRDISRFDSTNDRPITEIYKSIQTATIPFEQRFFREYTGFSYGEMQSGKDLYDMYASWLHYKSKKPIAEHTFLVRLKSYPFISKCRNKNKWYYVVDEEGHQRYIQAIEDANEIKEDEEDAFPDIY